MFENWKIRDRLLLGYAVPTIIFSIFSGIVYVNASQTIDTFQRANKLQEVVFGTDDMILRVSLMARQVRGYLLVGNAENAALLGLRGLMYNETQI
jgi:methyl-accepting chemotaxis protein WspA